MPRFNLTSRVFKQQDKATGLPFDLKRQPKVEATVNEQHREWRSSTGMPTRYVQPVQPRNEPEVIINYQLGKAKNFKERL